MTIKMTIKEKVIAGLRYHYNDESSCMGCPYHGIDDCRDVLMKDELEMLNEQEAVKPKLVGESTWCCGNCDALLGWEDYSTSGVKLVEYKFCPNCGRKVKWE